MLSLRAKPVPCRPLRALRQYRLLHAAGRCQKALVVRVIGSSQLGRHVHADFGQLAKSTTATKTERGYEGSQEEPETSFHEKNSSKMKQRQIILVPYLWQKSRKKAMALYSLEVLAEKCGGLLHKIIPLGPKLVTLTLVDDVLDRFSFFFE